MKEFERSNEMASKYKRVNGRGTRTKQDNAGCSTCGCVYNNERLLNNDVCFKCHGYTVDTINTWVANGKQSKINK